MHGPYPYTNRRLGHVDEYRSLAQNDARGSTIGADQTARAQFDAATLAALRAPVDAFFDNVMVMVDNETVKSNRLALLATLQTLLQGVADISMLQLI